MIQQLSIANSYGFTGSPSINIKFVYNTYAREGQCRYATYKNNE